MDFKVILFAFDHSFLFQRPS